MSKYKQIGSDLTAEAYRWHQNGDHPLDGDITTEGNIVRYFRHPDVPGTRACGVCHVAYAAHGWIDQGDEGIGVCPGDWVLTILGDEYLVLSDPDFRASWTPVDDIPEHVNHPKHYNAHPSGVECIDIVRHMNFNLGNAIKYIWRSGMKDGTPTIQDLEKAEWYIRDEIARLKKEVSSD